MSKSKYPFTAATIICAAAIAVAAPAASAQTEPFAATYTEHFSGPGGSPPCPDDAFACGAGTASGFGSFTSLFGCAPPDCATLTRTLTFTDGSTLSLTESFSFRTTPGNSRASHRSGASEGNPGSDWFTWTVDAGTGDFAGATGTGTDDFTAAGLQGTGTIVGTITTP